MRIFNGPVPDRIAALPVDRRGFPVPYFVAYQDGEPYFPAMDPEKMRQCLQHSKCWICGQRITAFKCFCIGPMCVINRISAEPPQHLDCARFAAMNCPFMTQPLAKRADATGFEKPGGIMIERNPGVTAIWVTKSFTIEKDRGKPLWRLGPPDRVEFWARGRRATRAEVDESVSTGLPLLTSVARAEGALDMLARQVEIMVRLLDSAEWPLPDVDLSSFHAGEVAP